MTKLAVVLENHAFAVVRKLVGLGAKGKVNGLLVAVQGCDQIRSTKHIAYS